MSAVPADLSRLRVATAGLVDGLASLTDGVVRRPSLLPGWTVGHVLSHLARNAEAIGAMVTAAAEGAAVPMYPSAEARADGIEAGAGRPAVDLVGDVVATAEGLDVTWPASGADTWNGFGYTAAGRLGVAEMPFRRWREVEVHRVDLGLAFGWPDWSDAYVERELPVALAGTPARTASGEAVVVAPDDDPRHVLAWLLGRAAPPPGHAPVAPWRP